MPPARPAPPKTERRLPIVPIVVVAVAVLAIVAVVVSRGGGDDDGGGSADLAAGVQATRPVEVSGDPLPRLEGGGADPASGSVAPTLTGATFDGSPVEIGADGTPKLLFFVAHWCPHCNREVPIVTEWLGGASSKDGVDVYAVSTGVDEAAPTFPPSEWLEEEGWPAPVLADDAEGSAAEAYGLSAYPFFVLLDGDHEVIGRGSGELSEEALDALVAAAG